MTQPLVTIVTTATTEYVDHLHQMILSVAAQTIATPVIAVMETPADLPSVKQIKGYLPFTLGAWRNQGIAQVTTPYVICVDADDTLEPTYVEKLLAHAAPYRVVTCGFRIAHDPRQRSAFQTDFSVASFLDGNKAIVSSLFPVELWRDVRGFAPRNYCDDWHFWIKCAAHGARFVSVDEHLLIYRESADGLSAKQRSLYAETRAAFREEFGRYL